MVKLTINIPIIKLKILKMKLGVLIVLDPLTAIFIKVPITTNEGPPIIKIELHINIPNLA